MITDDTILEKLRWQQFDRLGKSYEVAEKKYDDILLYIFADPNISSPRTQKGGIDIKASYGFTCSSFRGIVLSFWDNLKQRTISRCIEFKGTAKDFKAKVLEKFETLKSLLQEADTKFIAQKVQRIAAETEITELTEIAKRAFDKYEVEISKTGSGYRLTLEIEFNDKKECLPVVYGFSRLGLTLEIEFNDKRELLNFCDFERRKNDTTERCAY